MTSCLTRCVGCYSVVPNSVRVCASEKSIRAYIHIEDLYSVGGVNVVSLNEFVGVHKRFDKINEMTFAAKNQIL